MQRMVRTTKPIKDPDWEKSPLLRASLGATVMDMKGVPAMGAAVNEMERPDLSLSSREECLPDWE